MEEMREPISEADQRLLERGELEQLYRQMQAASVVKPTAAKRGRLGQKASPQAPQRRKTRIKAQKAARRKNR